MLNNCRASALLAEARIDGVELDQMLQDVPSLKLGIACGRQRPRRRPDHGCSTFDDIQADFPAEPLPGDRTSTWTWPA